MSKGLFILGTDTDVGKSVVTAGLVYLLRKAGYEATSFKAVQSGGIEEDGKLLAQDTQLVKDVAKLKEKQELMTPYCFKPPVSPHLAARLENIKISREKILNSYQQLTDKYEYIVAEGAGGLVVPIINNDYFIYDLIKDLDLPVLIVGRASVGTINHTTLTVKYAQQLGLKIRGIILNRYTDQVHEQDNIETIKNTTDQEIITVINDLEGFDPENSNYQSLRTEFESKLKIDRLLNLF